MRINKSFLFLYLLVFSTVSFGFDIRFLSPGKNQTVQKTVIIKIVAPRDKSVLTVPLWIKSEYGRERIKWLGYLKSSNKFKIEVDVSTFSPGKYEIEAMYGSRGREYDGDTEFYIQ